MLFDDSDQKYRDFSQLLQKVVQLYDELLVEKRERINMLQDQVYQLKNDLYRLKDSKE